MSNVYIGTSGFSYPHWRGNFYPEDLPQREWFLYYTKYFDTVEINTTFYRQIKKETFANWRRVAGENFVFTLKGNRFITHVRKLKNCQKEVGKFFEAAEGLKMSWSPARNFDSASDSLAKKHLLLNEIHRRSQNEASQNLASSPHQLDVILWQLPPGMRVDGERLATFLKILSPAWRYAFEFRHPTWFNLKIFSLLREHNVATVFQDYPGWPMTKEVTADFVYLRFHGHKSLYSSCYTKKELSLWAGEIQNWLKEGKDVYAYFNNDALGYAVENARTLKFLISNI